MYDTYVYNYIYIFRGFQPNGCSLSVNVLTLLKFAVIDMYMSIGIHVQ